MQLISNNEGGTLGALTPDTEPLNEYIVSKKMLNTESYTIEKISFASGKNLKPLLTIPGHDAREGLLFMVVLKKNEHYFDSHIPIECNVNFITTRGMFSKHITLMFAPGNNF